METSPALVERIKVALAEMATRVTLTDEHQYIDNETGLYLQGVSSVSSIMPKDWMPAWGAKEAVKDLGYTDYVGDYGKALEVMAKIAKLHNECEAFCKSLVSEEEIKKMRNKYAGLYVLILKEAKGAAFRKSKQALLDGKKGHAWLEDFVKARIANLEPKALPGNGLDRPLTQFLKWEAENVAFWIASEALVEAIEQGYAGTLDGIAVLKDGRLVLVDFKFASHLGPDYYLQTAGYAYPFEKYGITFDGRIIIRLPKTETIESWDAKNFKYEMIPNNIEVLEVPSSYEADRDAFLHALPLKGWINYMKKMAGNTG